MSSHASYQRALGVLSGRKIVDADVSTSALLHAIFEAGMAAVQKEAESTGYAEIASLVLNSTASDESAWVFKNRIAGTEITQNFSDFSTNAL